MNKDDRILITNTEEIVGKTLAGWLEREGFKNLLSATQCGLDLLDPKAVSAFFKKEKPKFVFLTSIKSGGIEANIKKPAEFFNDNLSVQANVMHSAWLSKITKLLFVGASCIYPENCPQPMREEHLLTGSLEPASEAYSIAKICGIKMCEYYNKQYKTDFISIVPATIYGPHDDFDVETSHVIPALIRRFHEAKLKGLTEVVVWGSGAARREFIYEEDMADCCIFLMQLNKTVNIVNVGTGYDITIRELAFIVKDIVGFGGQLNFDTAKPEGSMQKLLDLSKISSFGWRAKMDLMKAIKTTYEYYCNLTKNLKSLSSFSWYREA